MAHIFVVEDNPTLRENIVFELEMMGYEVTQASDGLAAIGILQGIQKNPDLIISDIAMPEMSGYELLEAVRKNDQWSAIPFIFLTAFDTNNAIQLGKQLGVDDYLVKPFEPEDLILAIENKLKRYAEIHKRAERDLDEKRRELVNMIAHELRTPMTAIYGGLEMLEYSLKNVSDETTLQMLELVDSGTKRLHRLINRVVLMVQIESGQLKRLFESQGVEISVNDLLLSLLSEFDFEERKVSASVKVEDTDQKVYGIPQSLKTAFLELIDNAAKFSHPNTKIVIETTYTKDKAHLTIQDEGVGIPNDQLDRIWDSFIQIDRSIQEQQGIGIGLALVQKIISIHGGECKITSVVKQGTKVTLILPLTETI